MPTATQTDILFSPSPQSISSSLLNHFLLLTQQRNPSLSLKTYQDLHSFSIQHKSAFWALVWEFCGIIHSSPYSAVVDESVPIDRIPEWFSGSRLNFAENMLHYADTAPDACALMFEGEHFECDSAEVLPMQTMTYAELRGAVAKCAFALRTQSGVGVGDVVAAYAPNCIEVVVYMLAAASLGAVFTATSPDFGVSGVLERFQQTKPKVLLSCNAVYYNGKVHDHTEKVEQVAKGLSESLVTVIMIPYYAETFSSTSTFLRTLSREWKEYTSNNSNALHYEQLPFNHPLYIMYSSGTTGKPKCLVHSAGGTLIQHKKEHMLHADLRPGEVIFQYTTIGWMMWQWLVSALSIGATVLLYDGSPLKPTPDRLFKIASKVGVSVFGTSAKFIQSLQEMSFKNEHSCPKLRMILSTGSPLSPSLFHYVYSNLQSQSDVILGSMSGGTDIISLFVGMNPMLPVRAGEIQCKCLGMAVECYSLNDNGSEGSEGSEGRQEKRNDKSIDKSDNSKSNSNDDRSTTDRSVNSAISTTEKSLNSNSPTSGELICTKAFPSMPIYFLNDPDGSKYFNSYFATVPGVWFHGDYIQVANEKSGGGIVMLGRSDGTLNPGGVRFGSSEIYNVMMMQQFSARVEDTLVVGQRLPSSVELDERVLMFVKMRKGFVLDDELISEIKQTIRKELSPRHVPYSIRQCPDIPYTVNGKKVELAVKRIVCKMPSVHNVSSLANAESLKWFEREVFD